MQATLRIALVAGEASGDRLGGALLEALRARCGALQARGIGGACMRAAGLESLAAQERLAVMGLVEPLARLPGLLRLRRRLRGELGAWRPDVFVGIDAPDFNLGLERWLRAEGIPVVHYVSPAVWAWRAGRLRTLRECADLVLTLFPFEEELLRAHGIAARHVGHPLAASIPLEPDRAGARAALGLDAGDRVLAVLPGSRAAEIRRLAPVFLEACALLREREPGLRVLLPAADAAALSMLERVLAGREEGACCRLLAPGGAHSALAAADLVLTASGTATLEAMLHKRPMVVAYRMAAVSYALVSRLLRSRWVALPNILAGEAMVPELLQRSAQPRAIAAELFRLLQDGAHCAALIARFRELHHGLRAGAGSGAAEAVLELLATRRGA